MSLANELEAAELAAEGKRIVEAIASRMEAAGYSYEDVGRLTRFSHWQQAAKVKQDDGTDEVQTTDLYGFQLSPVWATGPEWPVVQPAAPVKVTGARGRPAGGPVRVTVALPDPQFGYRRLDTGELIPIHDPAACSVALEVTKAARPDRIVNLGDFLDLNEWSSKFLVTPEFVETTQPALDAAHAFLAQQVAIAPEVDVLEGNHDDRLAIGIATNARAALRLRQAASTPETWPVLSMPHLLRLEELGVTYHDGYPANRTRLAAGNGDNVTPLFAIHGELTDVAKTARQARQSYIMGHLHRRAQHCETFEVDGSEITVEVITPGCLCRIDGAVPSTRSAKTRRRPLTRFESWQQGLAIITEYDDGSYAVESVPIHRGTALWRGKRYESAL